MSKIGNKNILIPKEVNVTINSGQINIQGPKGNKTLNVDEKLFEVKMIEKKSLSIKPNQ